MVELSVRLLLAGLLILASGLKDIPPMDFAWKAAIAISLLGGAQYFLDTKNYKNPGIAGFFAISDAMVVSLILASADQLTHLSFLVLTPVVWSFSTRKAQASLMAPIVAATIFFSYTMFHGPVLPPIMLLFQIGAILTIGLMLPNHEESPAPRPQSTNLTHLALAARAYGSPTSSKPATSLDTTDDFLELRENYRKLKDTLSQVEVKAKRDHLLAKIETLRNLPNDNYFSHLLENLRASQGIDSMVLYRTEGSNLIVESTTGDVNEDLQSRTIPIRESHSLAQMKDNILKAVRSLIAEGDPRRTTTVLIHEKGKIVGALAIIDEDTTILAEAETIFDQMASHLGKLIQDRMLSKNLERRARNAEILYEAAVISAGSETASTLSKRIVNDISQDEELNHVSVFLIEPSGAETCLAQTGQPVRFLETMDFATGEGVSGWAEAGYPGLSIADTSTDSRCQSKESRVTRINSVAIEPLSGPQGVFGYICIGSRISGVITQQAIERLRLIAGELSRALLRLEGVEESAAGLMPVAEFHSQLKDWDGYLVTFEAFKKDQLEATFGRPAVAEGIKNLSYKLRNLAPIGSSICRRSEGGMLVRLPEMDKDQAESWAKNAASSLSAFQVFTMDTRQRIPISLRSKLAKLTRTDRQILEDTPSEHAVS